MASDKLNHQISFFENNTLKQDDMIEKTVNTVIPKITVNIMNNIEKRKPTDESKYNIRYYQNKIYLKENTRELDFNTFVDMVSNQGALWKSSLLIGGSKNDNFKCAYVLSLDFDEGIKFDDFIKEAKKIKLEPTFIYETYSSEANFNKFRAVYRLDEPIYDKQLKTELQLKLMNIFPNCDKHCKDLSRLWVGGKNLVYYNLNNTLNIDTLNSLTTNIKFDTGKIKINDKSINSISGNKSSYNNTKVAPFKKHKLNYPIDLGLVKNNCMLYDDFTNGKRLDHMEIYHLSNNLHIYNGYDTSLEKILKKYNYNNWENKYNTVVSSVNYDYKASRCNEFCTKYYSKCNTKNIRKKMQDVLLDNYLNNINLKENLKYDKYLADNVDIINKLNKICVKEGTHLVEALTGAGKTYLIAQTFKELSEKYPNRLFIIACPNKIQNEQNEKSYKLKALVGGEYVEEFNSNLISMVYDKASNITDYLVSKNKDLTLIIDEAHQLIYSNNFRKEAITQLEELQSIANTTIHLTATTRTNLHAQKYNSYLKCTPFKTVTNIDTLNLIYGTKESLENSLIRTIKLELSRNKKVVVFVNNKEFMTDLYEYYLKDQFKGKNIALLDSDKKGSDLFNSIVDNSIIPNYVDILLTTSVLECGTNLNNNNLSMMYFVDSNLYFNLDNIEQSLNRARQKQDNSYVFISKENTDIKVIPLNYVITNYKMNVLEQVKILNEIYNTLKANKELEGYILYNNITAILNSKNIKGHNLNECVYFDEFKEEFIIDDKALIKQAIQVHDRQLINNSDKLQELLLKRCKASKVNSINLDENIDKLFKVAKNKLKEDKKELKEEQAQKEQQLKEDLKDILDDKLILYFEYMDTDDNLSSCFESGLTDRQKQFIDKLKDDEYYYNIILDKVLYYRKQYTKYKKYKDIHNIDYYLSFEELLDTYINSSSKTDFENNVEAILFAKYNKQSWSKCDDILEKLKQIGQEYSTIRIYLDKKLKSRLTDNLLIELYKDLNPKIKKEPSKSTLKRLKIKIKAIYNINANNKISSLK